MKSQLFLWLEKTKTSRFLKSQESKNLLFFLLAVTIALLLFYVMSVLISSGKNVYGKSSENLGIHFLMDENIDELELRDRRRPKKPEPEEAPPQTPKMKIQQTEIQKPNMSTHLPQLELPTDFNAEGGMGVGQQMNQNREETPIFRINPSYPRRAAINGVEGFVILKFDITESGETDNISVLQASPPQIFNSNAIQALKKWKYKARVVDGKAVRQNNLKVQLDFKLDQN